MTTSDVAAERIETVDLGTSGVRALNARLHAAAQDDGAPRAWRVSNPGGRHAVAVGLDAPLDVTIDGHVGYYCAGMNQHATVRVLGSCGVGLAENIMSGSVFVKGDASQAAGATGRGGLVVVEGNASARCAISLKGADVVVHGSIGHMGAFMAQSGRLVVCGDVGDALGDSLYETRIYVRGRVAGLGADCVEKELRDEHADELRELIARAGVRDADPSEFRRYGSGRNLYTFDIDDAGTY